MLLLTHWLFCQDQTVAGKFAELISGSKLVAKYFAVAASV